MAETPADDASKPSKEGLDLNSLSGLDFGPSWADENAPKPSLKKFEKRDQGRGRGPSGGKRDRRPPSRGAAGAGRSSSGGSEAGRRGDFGREHSSSDASPHRGGGRRDDNRRGGGHRRQDRDHFVPTVNVEIYPQDEAFDALVKRLRATVRTYQLFEIAHLLLEKPERFVVVVSNQRPKGESKPAPLYYSVPGHLPFETEEAVINHILANELGTFFDIEEIELDPPKGNFPMVNKCGITGALLGPPNYHRYQEFLQRHYNDKINGMSYDRFLSKVEAVKDQESIDAWVESMKKGLKYTLKDRQEGEPESFESLDAVRSFLLKNRKDKVLGSGDSIRFAGRDIQRLPEGAIARSVKHYVEQQRHFPLDSANNIRGRLRRHKFTVYKKGSKGVSYVCAVKRKFRDSSTVFTNSIHGLISFIEENPNIEASKLPKAYIGIDTEKQQPTKLEMTEAEIAAAALQAREAAEKAKAEAEAAGTIQAEAASSEKAPEQPEPVIDANAIASTDATPKTELAAEDQKRLNQLMLDLRWLIVEGYVTEYGDGRLFAPPPMPEPKAKQVPETKVISGTEAVSDSTSEQMAESEEKEPKPVVVENSSVAVDESVATEPDQSSENEALSDPKADTSAT